MKAPEFLNYWKNQMIDIEILTSGEIIATEIEMAFGSCNTSFLCPAKNVISNKNESIVIDGYVIKEEISKRME